MGGSAKTEEVQTFEELERNAKVDSELERLMAEMGMSGTSSNDDLAAQIQAMESGEPGFSLGSNG